MVSGFFRSKICLSFEKTLVIEKRYRLSERQFFDFSQPLTLYQVLALAAENSRDYRMHKERCLKLRLIWISAYDFGFQLDDLS